MSALIGMSPSQLQQGSEWLKILLLPRTVFVGPQAAMNLPQKKRLEQTFLAFFEEPLGRLENYLPYSELESGIRSHSRRWGATSQD